MTLDLVCQGTLRGLVIGAALAATLPSHAAHAWAIGSQINEVGCHEPLTAQALRNVRARFDTAPALRPSRDEAAMIADVLFRPPSDLVPDLGGMTLLLAVRDSDLKGIDPLSSLDLVQVHGDPDTQDEHCIRSDRDDGPEGDRSMLAACRAFIVKSATEALDGLDASGVVDPAIRLPLTLYVATRGKIEPLLPLFYLKMGAAMHALEDGFPHTYRTSDGMSVTVVLNWIDLVGDSYDEPRDGPAHRPELDRCWDDTDPTIRRNYDLTLQAATDLLSVALDPALTREQKTQQFDAVAAKYLGYQPGCTFDNQWCAPPEASVTNSIGCRASGNAGLTMWSALAVIGLLAARRRRPGPGAGTAGCVVACALAVGFAAPARADDPPPVPPPAPPQITDATAASQTASTEPAVERREPGRDVKTPTPQETAEIRADKQLGSPWGVTGSFGGSVNRAALVGTIGLRYRIREQWIVGVDTSWNPWVTTSPMAMRAGVATLAATVIRRFPMRFDRVNLRSSLHLGASMLLFDVYGAPQYSIGPYGALSVLGLDYDLGNSLRIVWDPMEVALPVPLLGQLPLYYEQFRFMIGIQIGS